MRYGRLNIKSVRIEAIHDDWWSKDIGLKIKVKSIGRELLENKNILRTILLIDNKNRGFINELRKNKHVIEILNIFYDNNKLIIDLIQEYNNTIFKVLKENNAIVINSIKMNGKDIWKFLVYDYQLNRIIKELKSMVKIERIEVKDYDSTDDIWFFNNMEFLALKTAYEMGYFENPRRITIKELSKIAGISESAYIYYLRRAQKKLIKKYLDSLDNIELY